MKRTVMLSIAVVAAVSYADDLYVDCGGTKPYTTIQAAVDAANVGDTVYVLPGVYDAGGYVDANGYTNRVYINKSIRLVATSSNPDDTHIVGARDTTPSGDAQGRGPAAVRGVYIADAAADTVVRGFTIRGCATPTTASAASGGMAGGTVTLGKTGKNNWYVDCVLSDNVGCRGAHAYGGYFLRCRFEAGYNAEAVQDAVLVNCLVIDNPTTAAGGGNYLVSGGAYYNCTFFNCRNNYFAQGLHTIYNCLFAGPANTLTYSAGKVTLTHSVLSRLRADNKNAIGNVDESHLTMVGSSFVDSNMQFFAPAFNDYRLLPTSAAIDAGAASHISDLLATVTPPEGVDVWKDYYGHDVPKTGAVNVGCCQEVSPAPTVGAVFATGADFLVDGKKVTLAKYFFPETYPTQFHATVLLAEGEGLFCFKLNYADGGSEIRRYPMLDDSFWFMPGSDASISLTCTVVKASSVKYARPGADVATATGAADHPYPTLQQAVDDSLQDGLVVAAAGNYNEGGGVDGGLSNRVVATKRVRIRGAGAGQSVIWGRPDDLNQNYGLGANAVRCVSGSSNYGCVQGFTLINGYGGKSAGGNETMDRGGAVYSGNSFVVADCLITNCVASRGGASRGAAVIRSRVTCSGYKNGRLFEDSVVVKGCVVHNIYGADCAGFDSGSPAPISDTKAIHSTVIGYGSSQQALASGHNTMNCVVSGGYKPSTSWAFTNVGLVVPPGFNMPEFDKNGNAQDFTVCEIRYADPAAADYRLMATSEVFGKGVYESNMYRWYEPVMDGPLLFVDGKPTPGAYSRPVPVLVTPASIASGTMSHSGTNAVSEGESVTVSVAGSTRPFYGFLMDGEMHEGSSFVYTAPTFGAYGEASIAELTPVFSTNWYVNAAKADDSGDGFTPETAKKTLAGIMACDISSGDCIHAAPGDYNENEMQSINSSYDYTSTVIGTRVVIPEGVSLVSDEGPDVTFISGAMAPEEYAVTYGNGTGLGTNAVRCVVMYSNTRLSGFTVRGGRTLGDVSGANGNKDCYGGGIMGTVSSLVENCVISNNASRRAGAACGGTFFRCKFMYNMTDVVGAYGKFTKGGVYNCYFNYNDSYVNCYPMVNCFVGNDKFPGTTQPSYSLYAPAGAKLLNTICLLSVRMSSSDSDKFVLAPTNCVFTAWTVGGEAGAGRTIDETLITKKTAAQIKDELDDDLKIKSRSSFLVDAGSADALAYSGMEQDLSGGQRVYNGKIDIGPNEYDWRADFAGMIGGVSVTKASPEVTTNAVGKVRIPDGGSMEIVPLGRDARKLAFRVADGELSAAGGLSEETYTTDGQYPFATPANLSLSFLGEGGYADIVEILNRPGSILMIR